MPDLSDAKTPRSSFQVPFLGLTIAVTIDSYKLTVQQAQEAVKGETRDYLIAMNLEWNLTDGGEPVATDKEGLAVLTDPFIVGFYDALLETALPKATETSDSDSLPNTEEKTD